MKHRGIFAALLLACPLFAQQFEAASIKPPGGEIAAGVHIDGAQIRVAGLSLRDLLAMAYKIEVTLIAGPDWTATERFDISATLPASTTPAQLPEMIQALLADRFQLKLHKEKKEFPIYALLVAAGGSKMKETPPDPDPHKDELPSWAAFVIINNGARVNYGHGSSFSFNGNRFEAKKLTMSLFSRDLERFADRRIVDMTGLTGQYDFAFDVTEDYRAMLLRAPVWLDANPPPEDSSPAGLGDALRQIGLKLDARKVPLDVLVIDNALKTPTAN